MTDLVPVNPVTTVELDEHVALIDRYKKAKQAAAYWAGEIESLRDALLALMGDAEVATVNGDKVLLAKPIDSFNESAFRKANPDLHKLYVREVPVERLDVELLKRARPDVYAQYQVRPLKMT